MPDKPAALTDSGRRQFLHGTFTSALIGIALQAGIELVTPERLNAQSNLSPDAALQELLAGNQRFARNQLTSITHDLTVLKDRTVEKQEPFAGVLACADSLLPYEELDGDYTYDPTYDQVLRSYNRSAYKPAFLEESNYTGSTNCTGSKTDGSTNHLRRQQYWTMTSGATGYLTGDDNWITWFPSGWKSNLNTRAIKEFSYFADFFTALPWYKLVPDQSHTFVTAGYGTYQGVAVGGESRDGNCTWTFTNNYATAALTSDRMVGVVYIPNSPTQSRSTVTVALSTFAAGNIKAQWFDPTTNTYTTVSGSPFANSGAHDFTTPGANQDGDPDWVLLLQAQ